MSARSLAKLTALLCFALLLAGGLVHATGSGMACGPDWPLCKGEAFPAFEPGVGFEHYGHRFLAATVATLTLVLAILCFRRRSAEPRLRGLAVGAVALVVIQALLGRYIVVWHLPLLVKAVHLAVSMAFFATLLALAWRLGQRGRARPEPALDRATRRAVAAAALLVYLQILLGALVRHTSSGLACQTFPLCGGALWPAFGPGRLHMAHRLGALLVAAVVLGVSLRAARGLRGAGALRALALAAPVLVIAQIALGVLSVLSLLGVATVTAHLGTGALLLADLASLWLARAPLLATAPEAPVGARPAEVRS